MTDLLILNPANLLGPRNILRRTQMTQRNRQELLLGRRHLHRNSVGLSDLNSSTNVREIEENTRGSLLNKSMSNKEIYYFYHLTHKKVSLFPHLIKVSEDRGDEGRIWLYLLYEFVFICMIFWNTYTYIRYGWGGNTKPSNVQMSVWLYCHMMTDHHHHHQAHKNSPYL